MLTELVFVLARSNPATVACMQAGGTPGVVQTDKGEQGMCTLPSGLVCEEWAFFRGECVAASTDPKPPKTPVQQRD